MPFDSYRQLRWMFANKPKTAKKFVEHAKRSGSPVVKERKTRGK